MSRRPWRGLWLVAAPALASCGDPPIDGRPVGDPEAGRPLRLVVSAEDDVLGTPFYPEGLPLSFELEVPPGDRLSSYRWDHGSPVPTGGVDGRVRVPHGELGLSARTVLYAPFHEEKGVVRGRAVVTESGTEGATGRYGRGVRLAAGRSFLVLETEVPRLGLGEGSAPWAIEFWWSAPEDGRPGTVCEVPGVLELRLQPDGLLRLVVPDVHSLTSITEVPVRAGEWHLIGITNSDIVGSLNLFLDGAGFGRYWAEGLVVPPTRRFVLGSENGLSAGGDFDEVRISNRILDSAEHAARVARQAAIGSHRLTLEFESGEHSVELWSGALTSPSLESEADWLRGEVAHLAASDAGLQWVPASWSRDFPEEVPLARTTHPTLPVGEDRVFMSCGETRDTLAMLWSNSADTWIYHLDEQRWEPVEGHGPSIRCHQSAAYSPDHDVVFYPGGWVNEFGKDDKLADTWLFHVGERRWEKQEDAPRPLMDNPVVYRPADKRFYVFVQKQVWAFDPDEGHWHRTRRASAVDSGGDPLEGFSVANSPIAELDTFRDQVLLFGGSNLEDGEWVFHANTFLYDFEKNEFRKIDTKTAPSPRTRSAMAYDSKRHQFVMFGGVLDQFSNRMRDLWVFDPEVEEWRELECAHRPTRRGGFYKMAYVPERDETCMFGGRSAHGVLLNEIQRLHFDEEAVGSARYVFDRAKFPALDRLVAVWSGDVELVLESSRDALDWEKGGSVARDARFLRVSLHVAPPTDGAAARLEKLAFVAEDALTGEESLVVELLPVDFDG